MAYGCKPFYWTPGSLMTSTPEGGKRNFSVCRHDPAAALRDEKNVSHLGPPDRGRSGTSVGDTIQDVIGQIRLFIRENPRNRDGAVDDGCLHRLPSPSAFIAHGQDI